MCMYVTTTTTTSQCYPRCTFLAAQSDDDGCGVDVAGLTDVIGKMMRAGIICVSADGRVVGHRSKRELIKAATKRDCTYACGT